MTFADQYRRHYGPLYYWMLHRTHNTDQAEDLAATAFLKAWEKRGTLRDPAKFKSWVFQIAANELCDHFNHESASVMEPMNQHHDPADPRDFTEELAKFQIAERARSVLLLIKESRRRVLANHLRGLSVEESAQHLHVPTGTIGSRLHKAKQELRHLCYVKGVLCL